MNGDQVRGRMVAANREVYTMGGGVFSLESSHLENTPPFYTVNRGDVSSCGCPRWDEIKPNDCKHIVAVEVLTNYFGHQYIDSLPPHTLLPALPLPKNWDDEKITEMYADARRRPRVNIRFPVGLSEHTRRNHAYGSMRERLPQLLAEVVQAVSSPAPRVSGGQEYPTHERAFAVGMRVFSNRGILDAIGEMRRVIIDNCYSFAAPSKNSISDFMHDPEVGVLLRKCIERTASTVRKIETMVLVDASGFATLPTQVYLDTNRGRKIVRVRNRWMKAHVACGGVTSVICHVIVTEHRAKIEDDDVAQKTADVNFFGDLVRAGVAVWSGVKYALGDKAYLSEENIAICDELAIKPYIAIKNRWDPSSKKLAPESCTELFNLYRENFPGFQEIYRYRTKIEGVFSAMKRTSSAHFRSRGARRLAKGASLTSEQIEHVKSTHENELLAKCLVHNLRRLVVLEKFHDECVNFNRNFAFAPLPEAYFSTAAIELDLEANGDGDGGLDSGELAG